MADTQAFEHVRQVKREHEAELMSIANVVAVGVGMRSVGGQPTNEIVIVVSVNQKYPSDELDAAAMIPVEIDGVAIDVQQVGDLRATNE